MGNKMFLKCLSVLLLVGLFVCCLVSCGKKESAENIPEASGEQLSDKGGQEQTADNDGNQLLGPDGERLAAQSREFEVQYIRTGLLKDTEALSAVSVIHSSNELKKYYEENKDTYSLERRGNFGADYTIGFLDACDLYDDSFFESKSLVIIALTEGSGSTRHKVDTVKSNFNGEFYVNISSIVPEVGTCDIAHWHIIVSVDKEYAPKKKENVTVYYDDRQFIPSKKLAGQEDNGIDDFSFSLTFGVYGISSYDSKTGKLVKTSDATYPEKYITNYKLTDIQKKQIFDMISGLDIESYPDEYNPHGDAASLPYLTLVLSVKMGDTEKTVTVKNAVSHYKAKDEKGQAFLDVCRAIEDMLTDTAEWKALPEYEFYYD